MPAGSRWAIATDKKTGIVLFLDCLITPELRTEGIVRELIHIIQQERKRRGFEIEDRIIVDVDCLDDSLLRHLIGQNREIISKEVLADYIFLFLLQTSQPYTDKILEATKVGIENVKEKLPIKLALERSRR